MRHGFDGARSVTGSEHATAASGGARDHELHGGTCRVGRFRTDHAGTRRRSGLHAASAFASARRSPRRPLRVEYPGGAARRSRHVPHHVRLLHSRLLASRIPVAPAHRSRVAAVRRWASRRYRGRAGRRRPAAVRLVVREARAAPSRWGPQVTHSRLVAVVLAAGRGAPAVQPRRVLLRRARAHRRPGYGSVHHRPHLGARTVRRPGGPHVAVHVGALRSAGSADPTPGRRPDLR